MNSLFKNGISAPHTAYTGSVRATHQHPISLETSQVCTYEWAVHVYLAKKAGSLIF